MTAQKHSVVLEQSEETECQKIVRAGTRNARTITRARILLMTNERNKSGKTDKEICTVLGTSRNTVSEVRKRYIKGGLQRALFDAPRSGQPKRFTPGEEATVIAVACTDPPDGYGRWTLDLIREEVIRRIKKKIGRVTIDKILLKNNCKPWLKKNVVYS
jgi:transposase